MERDRRSSRSRQWICQLATFFWAAAQRGAPWVAGACCWQLETDENSEKVEHEKMLKKDDDEDRSETHDRGEESISV
jgi:hypothetical protein